MKTPKELLDELLKFIEKLAGKEGVMVFKELMKYDGVTEEQIADDLGMKVNDVRKVLYKFEEYGLVKSYKEKEDENNQIYYLWRIERDTLNQSLLLLKKEVLKKLEEKLEDEENEVYFYCPKDFTRLRYSEAMLYDFTCPKCGTPLEMDEDNLSKVILKKYVNKLKEEIENEEKSL
ncbi:transcription factor [Ignicoccus islandicus DSM 13165]|uniref:Transcription factor E n=1 Tax=Ignicoccus islandicus DSM 13165 TaxID=940295 RepID=A0A0U3FNN7_9CREN|nr:hypothetical protein [Ignicoccus islandicus]ALU11591.1 transcription factor [Ignicoccus islandicus DSM 13165]